MNRISFGQFASVLLITDVFALFCLMGDVTLITACGFLIGTAVQLAISLTAAYFYKNGGSLNKPMMWVYLIYILIWSGLLLVMLWNASEALSLPSENFGGIPEKFLISGLIVIVCLYASSPGIKALSRAAVIAASLGAVCMAIILIGSIPRWNAENLTDLSASNGFFKELIRGFVISGGLGSFTVLLKYTKGSPIKYTIGYFIGKAVIFTLIPVMTAAVAGGIMEITDFPVIMSAEISQPFSSQRFDSIFLIIFSILAVFAVAVQVVCASFLLSGIFPKFKKLRSTVSLILIIGIAFLMSELPEYSVIFAVAAGIIPLLTLFCKRRSA